MTATASSAGIIDTTIDMGHITKAVFRKSIRIILVTLVMCAIAFVAISFMPKLYESSATLLVDPRDSVFTRANGEQAVSSVAVDETTISSQIELIKSRDNILAAINTENLRAEPEFNSVGGGVLSFLNRKEAPSLTDEKLISLISDRLIVTQERSSRLIAVTFRSEDPALAARVANAIALSHIARIAGNQIADTRDASVWLDQEIQRLRTSVSDAERKVADFRVDNDLFMAANNSSLLEQQLSNLAAQISAAGERNSVAGFRAAQIRELLDQGQSVAGIAEVQASPIVNQLSQERTRLQGDRAQRSATLLSNHPTMRALEAQISDLDNQITLEGRRVASALEAQARIESDLQANLQQELEALKASAGDAAVGGVALAEMEREATAQRDLLNAYLIRYSEAISRSEPNAAFPDIRLVSRAAAADSPSSPKAPLILAAVTLASLLLQVGGVIFNELLSGRALKPIYANRDDRSDEFPYPTLRPSIGPDAAHVAEFQPELSQLKEISPPAPRIDPQQNEPVPAAEPITPSVPESWDDYVQHYATRLINGDAKRVFMVALEESTLAANFSEQVIVRLIEASRTIAEIDAGSGEMGVEKGFTDLCSGNADFGEVVHRGVDDFFAFVPWGKEDALIPNNDKSVTLVRALSDIYACVNIVCGAWPENTAIEQFAGLSGDCIVLFRSEHSENLAPLVARLRELGFSNPELIKVDFG